MCDNLRDLGQLRLEKVEFDAQTWLLVTVVLPI